MYNYFQILSIYTKIRRNGEKHNSDGNTQNVVGLQLSFELQLFFGLQKLSFIKKSRLMDVIIQI